MLHDGKLADFLESRLKATYLFIVFCWAVVISNLMLACRYSFVVVLISLFDQLINKSMGL